MPPVGPQESLWIVSGVCCAAEEAVLRKSLDPWLGPRGYSFNLLTGELAVSREMRGQDLLAHLRGAGFDAKAKEAASVEEPFLRRHRDGLVAGAAALLTGAAILAERAVGAGWPIRGMLLAAIVLGGWRVAVKALKALRLGSLDMNVLMTAAVAGALAIGKWDEAAAVIVLFSVALMLESYSVARTRRAVGSLMAVAPERASRLDAEGERTVPARSVRPGEWIVIRPGERIPLDGTIIGGESNVNESAITGESEPVRKHPGDEVYAGTINQRGVLTVAVTRGYEDTTLARIVQLIESAQASRAPVQSFIDRFAAVYTPAVFALALLVATVPPLIAGAAFGDWFYRALVLLVIACPCALVISTPVTFVSALAGAARRGILIKGGRHIETLSAIRAIAFDKTGTLTEGRPRLTDVIPLDSVGRDKALALIAALESRSEHPLAPALMAGVGGLPGRPADVNGFEALPGCGVRGTIGGTTYFLGNRRLCEDEGFLSREVESHLRRLSSEGKTAMVLGTHGSPLCVVATRDTPREQARAAMNHLRESGVRHLFVLSGDHATAVDRVADEVGLNQVRAEMLPDEKVESVKDLQRYYGTVAMVGDGVNDGPALAAADVGIAMGGSGTAIAIETADVVLMSDDLGRVPLLVDLSRRTMGIIRQNIGIALALKLIFLVLSVAGAATLWMALLADDGAALLVIMNGLRALNPGGNR